MEEVEGCAAIGEEGSVLAPLSTRCLFGDRPSELASLIDPGKKFRHISKSAWMEQRRDDMAVLILLTSTVTAANLLSSCR
jgi:hypothetical protein